MQWARILDQEWDLQAVKQVSYGSAIALNWFSYCVRTSCRGMRGHAVQSDEAMGKLQAGIRPAAWEVLMSLHDNTLIRHHL